MKYYHGLSSVPASLLDLTPDDVELVSISILFINAFPFPTAVVASGVENHGFVLIRQRCRGDGAVYCFDFEKKMKK